jgi:hypothetical protein
MPGQLRFSGSPKRIGVTCFCSLSAMQQIFGHMPLYVKNMFGSVLYRPATRLLIDLFQMRFNARDQRRNIIRRRVRRG